MFTLSRPFFLLACLLLAAALTGCVTRPMIDTSKLQKPATVAIVDIPKMRSLAIIGLVSPNFPRQSFTSRTDYYFELTVPAQSDPAKVANYAQQVNNTAMQQIINTPKPMSVGGGAAVGAIGGLVGGLIQGSAEETQKRAMGFQAEVLKRFPDHDLANDFVKALREALAARGIASRIVEADKSTGPRLRWAATDVDGKAYPDVADGNYPAVDADVLVQICPVAFYNAPGPMNSYFRHVSVGVALFDARSKAFIGMQTINYKRTRSDFEYLTYSGLLDDLDRAVPALQDALLSLVPKVASIVSADPQLSP